MAERCSLRDSGHLHHAERNSDAAAEHEADCDPLIVHAVMQQGAGNGQQHSDFTGPNPMTGSAG